MNMQRHPAYRISMQIGSFPMHSPGGAVRRGIRPDKPQNRASPSSRVKPVIIHIDLDNLSTKDLAQLFRVSDRAVRGWAAEGMPHHAEAKDFRYQWGTVLPWWTANKFRGSVATGKGSGPASKAQSEARIMEVKAQREELRFAKESGKLVPVEQIEPAWMRVAETVKNRVLTLPPAAKEAIPHLTTEDVKTLHRLCREALQELSQCPASAP